MHEKGFSLIELLIALALLALLLPLSTAALSELLRTNRQQEAAQMLAEVRSTGAAIRLITDGDVAGERVRPGDGDQRGADCRHEGNRHAGDLQPRVAADPSHGA